MCLCLCVSSTSGIPRPGPLLQVWNEKSTLTLQKWIRKHRGHNYQAPSGWNWRRWSANRSVSNHPPPTPLLPALCNPVGVLELIWCQERPFTTTHRLAGRPAGDAGRVGVWWMQEKLDFWRSNWREKEGFPCLCHMLMYVHSCMFSSVEVPQPERVLVHQGPPADYKPCFMRAALMHCDKWESSLISHNTEPHSSIMKWSWLYPWFTLAPVPLCFSPLYSIASLTYLLGKHFLP